MASVAGGRTRRLWGRADSDVAVAISASTRTSTGTSTATAAADIVVVVEDFNVIIDELDPSRVQQKAVLRVALKVFEAGYSAIVLPDLRKRGVSKYVARTSATRGILVSKRVARARQQTERRTSLVPRSRSLNYRVLLLTGSSIATPAHTAPDALCWP